MGAGLVPSRPAHEEGGIEKPVGGDRRQAIADADRAREPPRPRRGLAAAAGARLEVQPELDLGEGRGGQRGFEVEVETGVGQAGDVTAKVQAGAVAVGEQLEPADTASLPGLLAGEQSDLLPAEKEEQASAGGNTQPTDRGEQSEVLPRVVEMETEGREGRVSRGFPRSPRRCRVGGGAEGRRGGTDQCLAQTPRPAQRNAELELHRVQMAAARPLGQLPQPRVGVVDEARAERLQKVAPVSSGIALADDGGDAGPGTGRAKGGDATGPVPGRHTQRGLAQGMEGAGDLGAADAQVAFRLPDVPSVDHEDLDLAVVGA